MAPEAMRILPCVIKRFPKCIGFIHPDILAFECRQRDPTGGSAVRCPCPRSSSSISGATRVLNRLTLRFAATTTVSVHGVFFSGCGVLP